MVPGAEGLCKWAENQTNRFRPTMRSPKQAHSRSFHGGAVQSAWLKMEVHTRVPHTSDSTGHGVRNT